MAEIPFDVGVISKGNLINHRPKTWKKKKNTMNMIWTQSQSEKYEKQNEEAKTENRSQHMFGEARMGGGVSYYLQI